MFVRGNGRPYKYLGLFMKECLHGAVCKVPRHVSTWWMMAAHHDGVEELSPGTWTAGVISDSRPPVKEPGCGHHSASPTPFTLRSRVRTPFCASPQPLCPPSFLSLIHTDPFPTLLWLWPCPLFTLSCSPEAHLFCFSRASLKENKNKAFLPGKTSSHFCPNSLILLQAWMNWRRVRNYGKESWKITIVKA